MSRPCTICSLPDQRRRNLERMLMTQSNTQASLASGHSRFALGRHRKHMSGGRRKFPAPILRTKLFRRIRMTDEPVRPQRAIERTGQHSSADEAMEAEVSAMLKETAEKLTEDYYERFSAKLWEFGMGYPQDDPVPLQAVEGIAQALADASGYRVVLQAAVVEPIEGEPNMCRTVGQREVASADPAVFGETVRE